LLGRLLMLLLCPQLRLWQWWPFPFLMMLLPPPSHNAG